MISDEDIFDRDSDKAPISPEAKKIINKYEQEKPLDESDDLNNRDINDLSDEPDQGEEDAESDFFEDDDLKSEDVLKPEESDTHN